jgi:hypothetical protein
MAAKPQKQRLARARVLQCAAKQAGIHATGDEMGSEMGSMSIVHWIASVHGGRLDYRHEAGTNTFKMEFPVSPGSSGT